MPPRIFTIYVLQDPRPRYRDDPRFTLWGVPGVRYVGQTFKDVRHRLGSHLLEEANPYKSKWRAALAKDGLLPAIVPIHSNITTQEEADRLEIALIAEARQRLGNKLINLTSGGQGYYSDEQMHESRTRNLAGPDGYERPGNTPYECLIDVVSPTVRAQMLVRTNRDIREINYRAERESGHSQSTRAGGPRL